MGNCLLCSCLCVSDLAVVDLDAWDDVICVIRFIKTSGSKNFLRSALYVDITLLVQVVQDVPNAVLVSIGRRCGNSVELPITLSG